MKLTSDGVKAGLYLVAAGAIAYLLWKLYGAARSGAQAGGDALESLLNGGTPVVREDYAGQRTAGPGITGSASDVRRLTGRGADWYDPITTPSLDTMRGQGGIN